MSAGDFSRVCAAINQLLEIGDTFTVTDLNGLCDVENAHGKGKLSNTLRTLATQRSAELPQGYSDPPLEIVGYDGQLTVYRVRRHHVPSCESDGGTPTPRRPVCPTCFVEVTTAGTCSMGCD